MTPSHWCGSNDRLTFECLRYLFALAELHPHVGAYLATLPPDPVVSGRFLPGVVVDALGKFVVPLCVVGRSPTVTSRAGCTGSSTASSRSPWYAAGM